MIGSRKVWVAVLSSFVAGGLCGWVATELLIGAGSGGARYTLHGEASNWRINTRTGQTWRREEIKDGKGDIVSYQWVAVAESNR